MKTVVFHIYHGMGHFNACFKMARILSKEYDVVFSGAEFFKDYMQGQGFIYYPLKTVPFGMGFEKWINEQKKSKHLYLDILKNRWTNSVYIAREAELLQLMYDVEPDYLFIDSFQSTDFIILYRYLKVQQTKVGFIQTMLPTVIQKDYPPINSLVFPNNKPGIEEAIKKFNSLRLKKIIKDKLCYFGMDDTALINRNMRRNGFPKKYQSKQKSVVGVTFNNTKEFVLAPMEFDFASKGNTDKHYIGFMPDFNRIEIADVEYFKLDEEIRNKIKATHAALIYCSFGSVKSSDTHKVDGFLQKLLNAVRNKNLIVVISNNSTHHKQKQLSNIPSNVYLLKAAPQLEILERANIFITHGGLNSIKESIYSTVPMLVYPLHETTDTMGNSTRVVFHELGLRGDLLTDSEATIIKKIETLLSNDQYKKNIHTLAERDARYTEQFMEQFKKLRSID
jgi:zeaxanthin glucosyltransferase